MNVDLAHELAALNEVGWTDVSADRGITEIAQQLGTPVPSRRGQGIVNHLKPMSREQAHPRSMSAAFGLGALPFHTDGAYFPVPPRFVLLRAEEVTSEDRPTLLHDTHALFDERERALLKLGVWRTTGYGRPFLSSVWSDSLVAGQDVLRYDPCCMIPLTRPADVSSDLISRRVCETPPISLYWSQSRTVLIDNWRILHARGSPSPVTRHEQRVLARVLIATEIRNGMGLRAPVAKN